MAQNCFTGRYQHGHYILSKSVTEPERLVHWISQLGFNEFEQPSYDLNKPCRPRNTIYSFRCPGENNDWVMKVSQVNKRYRLARKIDLFLTGLYKDYAKVGFYGAQALYDCGVPVAKPLAFWTFGKNLFNKKSYFLCEKVPGEQTLVHWFESQYPSVQSEVCATAIAEQVIALVRKIHDCCLRHGDIHTGNFCIDAPELTVPGHITAEQLAAIRLYLLDYDNCSRTKLRVSWIKRFFDIRELVNLRIPNVNDEQLLTMYFDGKPKSEWLQVFYFWKCGGFNIRRYLGLARKRENRHLK